MTIKNVGGRRQRRESGSISLELAILMPGFVMLIVLAIVVGRQAIAQSAIELAAHDAARAASLSRTATLAHARADTAARDTLAQQGLACVSLSVDIDTRGFAVPVGQPAAVSVALVCQVSFADVALPGVPGGRTLRASFVSPLDQYRART